MDICLQIRRGTQWIILFHTCDETVSTLGFGNESRIFERKRKHFAARTFVFVDLPLHNTRVCTYREENKTKNIQPPTFGCFRNTCIVPSSRWYYYITLYICTRIIRATCFGLFAISTSVRGGKSTIAKNECWQLFDRRTRGRKEINNFFLFFWKLPCTARNVVVVVVVVVGDAVDRHGDAMSRASDCTGWSTTEHCRRAPRCGCAFTEKNATRRFQRQRRRRRWATVCGLSAALSTGVFFHSPPLCVRELPRPHRGIYHRRGRCPCFPRRRCHRRRRLLYRVHCRRFPSLLSTARLGKNVWGENPREKHCVL